MDVILLLVILYGLALLITYIMSRLVDEPIFGLSKTNGGQSVGRTADGSPPLSISSTDTETGIIDFFVGSKQLAFSPLPFEEGAEAARLH